MLSAELERLSGKMTEFNGFELLINFMVAVNRKRNEVAHSSVMYELDENGYKKIESWTHDITFSNDKNVILELHHSFQTDNNFGKEHLESIMKNLKRKGASFELSFENKNDEYIVLFFHLLRHQKLSGVGIKSFLDMYLFVKKYKEQLDFDYIHKVYESTKYYDDCLIIEEYIFDMFNDIFI